MRRLAQCRVLLIPAMATALVLALMLHDADEVEQTVDVSEPRDEAPGIEEASLRGWHHARDDAGTDADTATRIVGQVRRGLTGEPALVELRRLHDLRIRSLRDRGHFDELPPPTREDLLLGFGTAGLVESVRTDAEGCFALSAPDAGVFDVRAHATDGSVARRDVVVRTIGAEVRVTLDLPDGGQTLRGCVRTEDGHPFTGQLLVERGRESTHWCENDSAGWVADIDGQGTFTVGGLPRGSLALSVIAPGRLRLTNIPVVLPREDALTIFVPTSCTCRGRIVDASTQKPIHGAHLTAVGYAWTGRTVLVHTTSDANGGFAVGGPVIAVTVTVEAGGYMPMVLPLPVVSSAPLVLGLIRGGEIRGRLIAAGSGEAVAGVTVYALPPTDAPSGARARMTRSDASGAFALRGLCPGVMRLFAAGAGWVSANRAEHQTGTRHSLLVAVGSGGTTEIDLVMLRACRLEGSVRNAAGAPVGGAQIFVAPGDERALGMLVGLYELDLEAVCRATAPDGSFAFDNLLPGCEHRVHATGAHGYSTEVTMTTRAGGETSKLDVVLVQPKPSWWLDVAVISSTAEPLAGARVEATGSGSSLQRSRRWTTNARGLARIGPFATKQVHVRALAADHVKPDMWSSGGWQEVTRDPQAAQPATTLVVDRGRPLTGRVIGPPGAPLERVGLAIDPDLFTWTHSLTLGAVGHDGRFSVPGGVGAGHILLYAVLRWDGHTYHCQTEAGPNAEDVEVELRERDGLFPEMRQGTVVRLIDPQGRPAACGYAAIHEDGDKDWSPYPAFVASGCATFDEVPRRSFHVEVWGGPRDVWGAGRFGSFEAGRREIEIHLGPERTVAGSVHDPAGRPQEGVRIEAHRPGCRRLRNHAWEEIAHAQGVTDNQGRFVLRGLGDLEYRIKVHIPTTHEPAPEPIVRGGTRDLEIVLRTGVSAVLTIVDPDGSPIGGGWIEARASKPGAHMREEVHASVDSQGVARLVGLSEDAEYVLTVNPPGGENGTFHSYTRNHWKPQATTIRLAHAYTISGRVLDLAGTPLAAMEVFGRDVKHRATRMITMSRPDGTFSLKRLHAGPYEVWARPHGVQTALPRRGVVVLEAGTQDVDLRVDIGRDLVVHLEDWPDPSHHWGMIAELRSEPPCAAWHTMIRSSNPSTFRFRGLLEDATYALWIHHPNSSSGTHAFARGLRAGQHVRLVARELPAVEVELLFPEGVKVRSTSIYAEAGGHRIPAESSGKTHRIPGVPDGVWTVYACVKDARGRTWRGTGMATPGSRIEITVRAALRD